MCLCVLCQTLLLASVIIYSRSVVSGGHTKTGFHSLLQSQTFVQLGQLLQEGLQRGQTTLLLLQHKQYPSNNLFNQQQHLFHKKELEEPSGEEIHMGISNQRGDIKVVGGKWQLKYKQKDATNDDFHYLLIYRFFFLINHLVLFLSEFPVIQDDLFFRPTV